MKNKRRLFWLIPLCSLLALACIFGGLFAIRGDCFYRLRLRLRHYEAPDLTAFAPDPSFSEISLEAFWEDKRVTAADYLALVSASHPYRNDETLLLADVGNRCRAEPVAAQAFFALRETSSKDGKTLLARSGYRSLEEQAAEWAQAGDAIAAKPGESEHQTGLAIDVCVAGYGGASFLKTRTGRYVNSHCSEYGFIIRYPYGKEAVTGFAYEPWHLRYVGAPHAEIISDAGLALEEYLNLLAPGVWYQSGSYCILRTDAETIPIPSNFVSCTVSRDNLGYRVFTFQCAS